MDNRSHPIVDALIAIGDDHLILGHRLSEWCGHAPMLEEDLSLANMGLDLLGQASALYTYASRLEGAGRSEDDLAYLRRERDYRNCLLVERPNGDFAHTVLRQFYFAAFIHPFWTHAEAISTDDTIRGIAGKARKESAYHLRHCAEWVIRLGDGTEESAARMGSAVQALHVYTGELFAPTPAIAKAVEVGALPDPAACQNIWEATIADVFAKAFLAAPELSYHQQGGRDGIHTEDFGHLLAELQFMQRAYPGLSW